MTGEQERNKGTHMHPALKNGLKADPLPEEIMQRALHGLRKLDSEVKGELAPGERTEVFREAADKVGSIVDRIKTI